MKSKNRIQVLLPQALPRLLDYRVLGGDIKLGQFVEVPLGRKKRIGVVWALDADKTLPDEKVKPIFRVLDVSPMDKSYREFINWVARYTMAPMGNVIKMGMSVPEVFEPPLMDTFYVRGGDDPQNITTERAALLERLVDSRPRSVRDLSLLGQVGEGVVRGLIKCGTLTPVQCAHDKAYAAPDCSLQGPSLSKTQKQAAEILSNAVRAQKFAPILLEGVTGSGKTEVYFEAIIAALEKPQGQVLVLLPEISLTAQWLERFNERFGCAPVLWHSDVGTAERRRAWRGVASGHARLVVGARSALFLPFQDLKLIIIDEEHDPSYKQEEGVIYNARDMAVLRARGCNIPIILASATPSFETLFNVSEGKYQHINIIERHGSAGLPNIEAIDLRTDPPLRGQWLSPILTKAIEETIARNEQAMLFLNRRGYAPLTLCRHCGERINCPHCSAWLVEHRSKNSLECHHCGHSIPRPEQCPTCGEAHSLAPCGPGVERIEEEIVSLFPHARILVMTSDTVSSPDVGAGFIAQIQSGAVDIIIGTQIITKGYHFPKLTLVGVVDADLGLKGADLRASERTYQQMAQVAGRAGREEKQGHVYLQTFMPDHPVARALCGGDIEGFRKLEFDARLSAHMPPFGRMAALILSGPQERALVAYARQMAKTAPNHEGVTILGPAPAPIARLRGQYRYRFLVISEKAISLQKVISSWLENVKKNSKVTIKIDIDPQNFN